MSRLRTRIANLETVIVDLQAKIEALEAASERELTATPFGVKPPAAISDPLDFHAMSAELAGEFAGYDQYEDVYGAYL